jgi:hypothetical protein
MTSFAEDVETICPIIDRTSGQTHGALTCLARPGNGYRDPDLYRRGQRQL